MSCTLRARLSAFSRSSGRFHDDPLFHTMFDLERVPQIPGIGTWLGRGETSERGADSAQVHARGISDRNGRVMVFMTHNTDVSDSWEREGEDPQYFYMFSIDGYRVAVKRADLRDDALSRLQADSRCARSADSFERIVL
jgi:Domain of unknown function (DUF4159)